MPDGERARRCLNANWRLAGDLRRYPDGAPRWLSYRYEVALLMKAPATPCVTVPIDFGRKRKIVA